MNLSGTAASLVETVSFHRRPRPLCEVCGFVTFDYEIRDARPRSTAWYGCAKCFQLTLWQPGDPPDDFPSVPPPRVLMTQWIDNVAVAYLMVKFNEFSPTLHNREVVARIGIANQWKDPVYGNVEDPGEPRKLFTQRYFSIDGPGVYPVDIQDDW